MITLADVQAAQTRIAPYVRRTATLPNATLSQRLGAQVYLKEELFQKTGAFKVRGAFNIMLQMTDEQRQNGAVAVSGGNHAQAVAHAGTTLGIRTRVMMAAATPRNYVEATRQYGAEVELHADIGAAFAAAEAYGQQGWTFVHPFNDPAVMAGQGTIGLEILEDVPQMTDLFLSVGGGGMLVGVAQAVKALKPDVRVWSIETVGADVLAQSLQAGEVVTIQPSSLARTLGAPTTSEEVMETARTLVEKHFVVTDAEAYQAQRFLLERTKMLTELAAAVTLVAAEKVRDAGGFTPESQIVLIMCGGNVSLDDVVAYHQKFEG